MTTTTRLPRAALAALIVAVPAVAQTPTPTLGQHLSLAPGTAIVYQGESRFSYKKGENKPWVQDHEMRVRLYVVGSLPDGKIECAQVVRSRKKGSSDPFAVTGIAFLEIELGTGQTTKRGKPVADSPRVSDRLFPSVPWPLTWPSFVRDKKFGKGVVVQRLSIEPIANEAALRRIRIRLEGDKPVKVENALAMLNIHEQSGSYIVDPATGRVVERQSRAEIHFDDVEQISEQALRLESHTVQGGEAHEKEVQRFRALEKAAASMAAPSGALKQLWELPADDVTAFLVSHAEKRLSWRKKESAHDARVAKIIGKPAPDFTLEQMNGEKFSLRDARGSIVLLSFWGVG